MSEGIYYYQNVAIAFGVLTPCEYDDVEGELREWAAAQVLGAALW